MKLQGGDPIFKRLARLNMLVCGTALLVACASFVTYDVYSFRDFQIRNLTIQAQIIGFNSTSALTFNDPQSAQSTLSAMSVSPNIVSAGINSADGRSFARYQRNGKLPAIVEVPTLAEGQSDASSFTLDGIVVTHAIELQGTRLGTVYIQSDLQRFYARLWQYLWKMLLILGASFIAAVYISNRYGKAVVQPIVGLSETAQIVSREKNYSVRVTDPGVGGEVSVLIKAFNEMLEQIQRRDDELQGARFGLEKRVEERTRQLVAANRELEAFSYSVSHDLRNPLETISGYSYILLQEYGNKLDSEGKNHLEEVNAATKRMAQLIDDLLALAHATTTAMHRERVNLSEMANAISNDLKRKDPQRNVEFKIANDMMADADASLLRVAMENLLSNAWKYTSTREDARIEVGCKFDAGCNVFYVRDNGAGFDPKQIDRLFKPFQRLHSKSEFPGTGVGLATVQRIIHRHGGQIWAEASPGQGATFYFMLQPEMAARQWA
jgi:signal transduction histidine kinase